MDPVAFERDRLALFARHGLEGTPRWITDRHGRRSYLITRGQGARPTLLLHGGLSQAGEWALIAGQLPGPVVLPDRPGCGLSYRIDYRRADLRSSAVAWMTHLVNELGAEQVDLVGNSMGGYFSLAFALAHPERVRRLVLVGAPMGLARDVPLFVRLWGTPGIGHLIGRLPVKDPETARKRIWPELVADPEAVPIEIIEQDLAAASLPGIARCSYSLLRAGTTLRGIHPRHLLGDEISRLHAPTLFLWGRADRFTPSQVGEKVAARMRSARFEPVDDAGHMPHIDRPGYVAEATTQFLHTQPTGNPSQAHRPAHATEGARTPDPSASS